MADYPRILSMRMDPSYEGATQGALRLMERLRPNWAQSEIICQPMTQGNVNYSVCCHRREDEEKEDAIVVRVNSGVMGSLVNRRLELAGIQLAHVAGSGQRPLAIFENGFAYVYAKGRTLQMPQDLHNTTLQRALGETLAKLHEQDHSVIKTVGRSGENITLEHYTVWDKMRDWIKVVDVKLSDVIDNERYQAFVKPSEEYRAEVDLLESTFSQEPVVWGHNDVYATNIIYDDLTERLSLVDFEYASFTTAPMEWGTFFKGITTYWDCKDGPCPEPTDELLSMWVKPYLEHRLTLQGKPPSQLTDDQLSQFCNSCRKAYYVAHLFWGFCFLAVLCVGKLRVQEDRLGKGLRMIDLYFKHKHLVVSD